MKNGKNNGNKLAIITICVLLPLSIIMAPVTAVTSLFGHLFHDDNDSDPHNNIVDICINNYPITADYKGEGWEWVPQCQKDIQAMRNSGVFSYETVGTVDFDGDGSKVVDFAKTYIGYPYKSGGNDPNTGADSTGFTKYVFAHFGININRDPNELASNSTKITETEAKPGDLILWTKHAAIYEGNDKIIHAENAAHGIRETPATPSYGEGSYLGYYRVTGVNDGTSSSSNSKKSEDQLSIIAEEKAAAVLLTYPYVIDDEGNEYASSSTDWTKYSKCFTEDDFTVDTYDPTTDASWTNLTAAGFTELSNDDIDLIITVANEIHGRIESHATIEGEVTIEDLKGYWTGDVPHGLGDGADAIWNKIDEESKGHFSVFWGTDRHQCTDVSHWLFWKTYGTDWSGGGNGNQCVRNICNTFTKDGKRTPEGYYFVISSTPEPGSVFSTGLNKTYGHTGFVTEVHDGYYLYIDGNISGDYGGKKVTKGIRINAKRSIAESAGSYIYAVPRKG